MFDIITRRESKMKIYKVRVVASIIMAVSFFSISASADDFTFANDTNVNLSVRINNICAPQFGIIEQHTQVVVTEKNLEEACNNQSNCLMKIFDTGDCSGTHIETIILNKINGIIGLRGADSDGKGNQYYWQADRFNLYVSNH